MTLTVAFLDDVGSLDDGIELLGNHGLGATVRTPDRQNNSRNIHSLKDLIDLEVCYYN